MENKQMDKRHQRTDDKSNQKTTNGFKNSTEDQQQPNADTHKSKLGSDWNVKNQPTQQDHINPEGQYDQNPKRNRITESAGVIDEDRGMFQDEEMDHPSGKRANGETVDTENSNIDSPKKKNQAPPSNFS